MELDTIVGIFAILLGVYTSYVLATNPGKFGKLQAMKDGLENRQGTPSTSWPIRFSRSFLAPSFSSEDSRRPEPPRIAQGVVRPFGSFGLVGKIHVNEEAPRNGAGSGASGLPITVTILVTRTAKRAIEEPVSDFAIATSPPCSHRPRLFASRLSGG
jgi:hypothetical protein